MVVIPVVVKEKVVIVVDAAVVNVDVIVIDLVNGVVIMLVVVLRWCTCGWFSQRGSNNVSGTISITSINMKIVVELLTSVTTTSSIWDSTALPIT